MSFFTVVVELIPLSRIMNVIRNVNTRLKYSFVKYSTFPKWSLDCAGFDIEYIFDETNLREIQENISRRKGIGDIHLVHSLKKELDAANKDSPTFKSLQETLHKELSKIPNKTHPVLTSHHNEPKIIKTVNEKRVFEHEPLEFHEITKRMNLVRTEHLGNLCGNRSYFLLGDIADLEKALIRYAVDCLLRNGFKLISVPDILPRNIIESCGMNTRGERTQVYSLDKLSHGEDLCLSGTSEMALGGYFSNRVLDVKEMPLKLAAVSRCYRAEISSTAEEKGIYRVHEFTKVEMFVVSTPESSEEELENIRRFEEEYFTSLGLHFQVLDMPPHELGAPAYRKYDIEAWLPGRKIYGELSSCSNCTDYQSRRLNIKYSVDGKNKYCHTLNGTACAIPRLLIALVENGQNKNGTISIPDVLQKYMHEKTCIRKERKIPPLKLIKYNS